MTLVLKGDDRTINAVRKADALPRNEKNGLFGNSTLPSSSRALAWRWAEIISITEDPQVYTADIYYNRSGDPLNEGVNFYVFDITTKLKVGDWVPAVKYPWGSPPEDTVEWVCPQQLGAVG